MATTLISFLGGNRGKDPKNPTYEEAKYDCNNKIAETSIVTKAIINNTDKKINQVIIIGSTTSIWEHLISEQENPKLYEQIWEQVESGVGISNDNLARCQSVVSKSWAIDTILYAGEVGISDQNAGAEMVRYASLLYQIKKDNEIVLDFTHGFRSMPVLLMSAFQYQYALTGNKQFKNFKLAYAEYNRDGISPIHFLDSLVDNFAIANATQLFFDKFEADELVTFIQPIWDKGAKALHDFSATIQGNYLSQLDQRLRQLKNALDKKPEGEIPPWFEQVYDEVNNLYINLSANTAYESIFKIADLLLAKHFNAQAILALLLSYEFYICAYYNEPESMSDYGKDGQLAKLKNKFRNKFDKQDYKIKKIRKTLVDLNETRNMIAHSGGLRRNGSIPNADNLISQYGRYRKLLAHLFRDYAPS